MIGLISFCSCLSVAGSDLHEKKWQARSDHRTPENQDRDQWNVKSGIESRRVYIQMPESSKLGAGEVRYDPESKQSYFVGFERNEVGVNVAVESLLGAKREQSYQDFRLYKFTESWSAEVSWMDYQGFNLTSSDLLSPRPSTSQRPDLRLQGWSLTGMYNLFPDSLSLSAIMNGTARQQKSGGSVIMTGSIAQMTLTSDRGLIPWAKDTQECCLYKNDLKVQSAAVGALGIYDLVFFQNWVTGIGWGVELGTQKVDQSLTSSASFESFATNRYFFNLGYQGKSFSALIYFLENTHQISPTQINSMMFGSTYSNFMITYFFD